MLSPAGFALVERLRKLTELDLPADGLDDAALGSLNSLAELKSLTLKGGDFSGTGFGGSVPTRPLAKLERLDVSGSHFDDAGCIRLARFCPKLATLTLSGTQVTDVGLKPLAKLPNLWNLNLNRTALSDAGLDVLRQFTRLSSVRTTHTRVTRAGTHALKNARPKLYVQDDLSSLLDYQARTANGTALVDDDPVTTEPAN